MTVKEVSIAMTPTEEKAITRLQTRRKRLQKKMTGGEEPVQEPPVEPSPSMPVSTPQTVSVPELTPSVNTPAISAVPEPQHQTGGSKVQIVSHKKHQTRSQPQSSGAAKILPTKRHVTVKRKPTVVVGKQRGGMQPATQQPTVTAPPVQPPTTTPPVVQPQTVTPPPVQPQPMTAPAVQPQTMQPQKAGALRKKRFTERRLSISMKHLKSTRKHKKSIRKKVKSMDIQAIRAILMEKGILTGKSNPPEKMLRSMMKDYLFLQASAK